MKPEGRSGLVTSGSRAEGMRRANASAVLRAVLSGDGVSRADIVRRTGLSAPAVTKLTASLIASGHLAEAEPRHTTALGRPRVAIRIDRDRGAALGVHIGLERTTLGLVALDGTVLAEQALRHEDTSPNAIVEQAAEGVAAFLREHRGGRRMLGTGVSIGGWVDGGTVVEHAALGWTGVPLADLLGARVPGPLRMEQHVRATAEAELWFGAGRETDDLVIVFIGQVVDAALVLGRSIHRGPGSAAGGIDHLPVSEGGPACGCGRTGCLSAVATDAALLADARRAGLEASDLDHLIALARQGDEQAAALVGGRAKAVGRAVALLMDLVNPGRVVLTGGVVKAPEHLDELYAEAARRASRGRDGLADRIGATELGPDALVVSAAAPVLAGVLADPLGAEA
ncbi:ROK family transcriptional regulator [Actinomadura rupiterrae]|uniref:ROK family transcriptional regulator n=1 Tax=Actinomadura rupiterrae TaxID=559627 RepID=UPI0020A2619A|nr:ROK family transcriptional regulator [Actinomadura rupiterrae]MCP2341126.1 putative NBD/HSP70 family sugar kinase [Actinomadura rupiterrae]